MMLTKILSGGDSCKKECFLFLGEFDNDNDTEGGVWLPCKEDGGEEVICSTVLIRTRPTSTRINELPTTFILR